MTKRLLIITRSRLSENNGGANASKGFIQCLADIFQNCSVICPVYDETKYTAPQNCTCYPYQDQRNVICKGLDMYRGRVCANVPFVKKHLRNNQYDIVVIDHSLAGTSLVKTIKATGAKLITIHHNVERDYNDDNRKGYSILYRLPYIHFANKAERDCLLNSDINLTLTEKDASTFRNWYENRNLHLHHWGTFNYQPFKDKQFDSKKKGKMFVITGSLYFEQSLHPILDFIHRYWPLLLQECPEGQLIIAGRNPASVLTEACKHQKNITIIPNPENMDEVIEKADYYISPVNLGSGLKLRIMDGLKQGLPVLCHDVSAYGYEDIANHNCLFAYRDEDSFISALRKMTSSDISQDSVYQTFRNFFSTETGSKRLLEILKNENLDI